jgi:NifU-like protein involved in Fe-S cluster formation
VGRLADADGIGRVDDPASETTISLYLKLDAQRRIARVTFRTFGCSACVAASSVTTELLTGCTVDDAHGLDAQAIDAALGGLPPEKRYCAELAAEAARRALNSLAA